MASLLLHQFRRRPFSSQRPQEPPSLKRLIQPFVMKCHPDMARQQGLPDSARKVNLEAIQNLNSYVDGINKLIKPASNKLYPFPNENHTVDIEFVIPLEQSTEKSTNISSSSNENFVVSTSRRKLEFLVPPMDMPPNRVQKYATRQFLKLLRISDLPIPTSLALFNFDEEDDIDQDDDIRGNQQQTQQGSSRRRPKSAWEASRERFWRRHNQSLDHQKFNRMYKEALHDAQVHIRTRNWIRDNPKLRHKLLANGESSSKNYNYRSYTSDVLFVAVDFPTLATCLFESFSNFSLSN